jgi:hypothetical protein
VVGTGRSGRCGSVRALRRGVGLCGAHEDAEGKLTTEPVTGPGCTSPVGICFTGTLVGGLKGTLTGTGTSVIPTPDTPTTDVVLLTADVSIQTKVGDLVVKDATLLRPTSGEFSIIWTVTGGTGTYSGATGVIQVTGSFVPGGTGTATYAGGLSL